MWKPMSTKCFFAELRFSGEANSTYTGDTSTWTLARTHGQNFGILFFKTRFQRRDCPYPARLGRAELIFPNGARENVYPAANCLSFGRFRLIKNVVFESFSKKQINAK